MYKDKKIIQIVARGLKGEIGKDNKLLWSIPEELKYFRDQTLGHVVMMGRKTYESLPKPLGRRVVYSVSRPKDVDDYDLLDYFHDAYKTTTTMLNTDCIFVAGGSQLYEATSDIVDELLITEVDKEYHDADVYFKQPDGFEMTDRSEWTEGIDRLSGDIIRYRFTTWHRLPF